MHNDSNTPDIQQLAISYLTQRWCDERAIRALLRSIPNDRWFDFYVHVRGIARFRELSDRTPRLVWLDLEHRSRAPWPVDAHSPAEHDEAPSSWPDRPAQRRSRWPRLGRLFARTVAPTPAQLPDPSASTVRSAQ